MACILLVLLVLVHLALCYGQEVTALVVNSGSGMHSSGWAHSANCSGWSLTCPLVCERQDLVRQCRKTVVPQLHSTVKVVDVFFVQFIDGVWTSLCSCSDVYAVLDIVVDMPVASNDCCFELTEQKTVVVPQLQCSDKVNCCAGRRLGLLLEAGVRGSSSVHRDRGLSARVRWRCRVAPFFALLRSSRS